METIKYRAYGDRDETLGEGAISGEFPPMEDEDRRVYEMMTAVAVEIGDFTFDHYVAGVEFKDA